LFQYLLEKILSWFNIPSVAVRSFQLSNKLSGLNKQNLPVELIPLNTNQLARGILNYTFFQHYSDWKLPFWAVQQYDPGNKSFIPRSHLGVSINVTNRNWTAIGNMNCDVEPIVDPRGSVMPFRNGWSIEIWIKDKDFLIFPAYEAIVEQVLEDDLPIVKTLLKKLGFILNMTAYTSNANLICSYEVVNTNDIPINLDNIIAIRPFNPEGISIVNKISFLKDDNCFCINDSDKVYLSEQPDKIILSDLKTGDSANHLLDEYFNVYNNEVACEFGLSSAAAIFHSDILPAQKKKLSAYVNLERRQFNLLEVKSKAKITEDWNRILSEGMSIEIPDMKLTSLIKASTCTSLQFCDSDSITPGPFIYHQFWFRDAAFQLNTLNKFGFNEVVESVLKSFPKYQKRDGCFQSQKGEWDSNGQVIWMTMQHALLSNNINTLRNYFDILYKAIKWIDKKRISDKNFNKEYFFGLLPRGLSAEHLGLADYYYWDNFWSLAGIKSFILICEIIKENTAKEFAVNLYKDYEKTLHRLLTIKNNLEISNVIPSAPNKSLDSGMIGTIAAIYPLQILEYDKGKFNASLEFIYNNYFNNNLFFQNIIHSGGNAYITSQIAHSFLYLGNRKMFNKILENVIEYASPTLNYPEAFHPLTGGGVIGDGHHGWAASEILSAIRDAFVFEKNYYSIESIELILLSGIPAEWFLSGKELSIKNAEVLSGNISIGTAYDKNQIKIDIKYISNKIYKTEMFKLIFPFEVKSINQMTEYSSITIKDNESILTLCAASMNIILEL
jgi:hypothetical protein